MPDDTDDTADDDKRPQRRRPSITGPGWLLFVCLFLPTLRVCGDPTAPIEFPPTYAVYLGALVLGALAFATSLKARRVWFTIWFTLLYATGVAWLALAIGGELEVAGFLVAGIGVICAFVVAPAFHRQNFTERGFWGGGLLHGVLALAWNSLLVTDPDRMWGAYVALAASVGLVGASTRAMIEHASELARRRREREPAPLPIARVVERDR